MSGPSTLCESFPRGLPVAVLLALFVGCDLTANSTQQQRQPATAEHHATSADDAVELGRALFTGKGNCGVCHTIGRDDDKSRGPDLAGIGGRAAQRAEQFGLEGLDAPARYLVRSIVRPAADVVDGYNRAPESWLPSGLTDDDIVNLVTYLQSLGGQADRQSISLPYEWLAAKRDEYRRELEVFAFGDPAKGKTLFHDAKGKAGCIKCHKIDGVGSTTCPNLTTVNRVQRPSYVLESILNSSEFIVRGYRQIIILDVDGRVHTGLPTKEDEETITLVVDQDGKTEVIRKRDIDEQMVSKVSQMPAGFSEQLTAEQVMNLVAYVTQHREAAAPQVVTNIKPEPDPTSGALVAAPSLDVFGPITDAQRLYRTAMERGDPKVGARIYGHYCVMCHGPQGDGTGFNAVNLATKPANHTDDRRMSKTEDLLLHGVISNGGMKTGRSFLMPPWGGTLAQRERWDLIAYIRTLHADVGK